MVSNVSQGKKKHTHKFLSTFCKRDEKKQQHDIFISPLMEFPSRKVASTSGSTQ
jgi:hypothetical protein